MTGHQTFVSLRRNIGPLPSTKLFYFSHIGGFSTMNCLFQVLQQQLNGIQARTLTKPLQNFNYIIFQPFISGFTLMLQLVVLLHKLITPTNAWYEKNQPYLDGLRAIMILKISSNLFGRWERPPPPPAAHTYARTHIHTHLNTIPLLLQSLHN